MQKMYLSRILIFKVQIYFNAYGYSREYANKIVDSLIYQYVISTEEIENRKDLYQKIYAEYYLMTIE